MLALLGWHVLAESQYRVERGRIGSDIYTALLVFDLEKSTLRNWSYRRAIDQPAEASERVALLGAMREQISKISTKAERAALLDRARGKVLPEHDDRLSTLAFLEDVVTQLDLETELLLNGGTLEPPILSNIDVGFDQLRGVSFADALRVALSAEADALIRERDRANQSLAAARTLFLSAGGFGLVATFAMALFLARRLRQPFGELEKGLAAYGRGDFSYRFDRFRDREFVNLGSQLNAMATEVELARTKAAENRAKLERTVATRTRELRRTLDELSASEGARQKLLADISHELRTPITVIRGEAQVALRQKSNDSTAYRGALERIVDVSRQMGDLIEDLMVLVRDPQAQPDIKARRICVTEAILPAIETARTVATQREVDLQFPDPLPVLEVWADPNRLRQIVTCLLDNALRYSFAGGMVRLDIHATSDVVMIEICDQGIGMEPDEVQHAFDRGWRSVAARAHRPDGLGLGLAIARQLTEAQGGQLSIRRGADGRGVIATLAVPAGPIAEGRGV
jgi:signal transduction histidine kinase